MRWRKHSCVPRRQPCRRLCPGRRVAHSKAPFRLTPLSRFSTIWGICFALKANPSHSDGEGFLTVLPRYFSPDGKRPKLSPPGRLPPVRHTLFDGEEQVRYRLSTSVHVLLGAARCSSAVCPGEIHPNGLLVHVAIRLIRFGTNRTFSRGGDRGQVALPRPDISAILGFV